MSDLRKAAEQALDALGYLEYGMCDITHGPSEDTTEAAIEALRAALAQPEQEPVVFITPLMEQQMFDDWCPYKGSPDPRTVWAAAVDSVNGLLLGASAQPAQAEPEQEPVAWQINDGTSTYVTDRRVDAEEAAAEGWVRTPLYTTPTPRKPLTEEQIYKAIKGVDSLRAFDVARAIERAHGIGEQT